MYIKIDQNETGGSTSAIPRLHPVQTLVSRAGGVVTTDLAPVTPFHGRLRPFFGEPVEASLYRCVGLGNIHRVPRTHVLWGGRRGKEGPGATDPGWVVG